MSAVWAAVLAAAALLLVVQFGRALGAVRGTLLGLLSVTIIAAGWWLLGEAGPTEAGPADWAQVASVSSETCAKCHADHYDSWYRTYHRTMTRDAAPDTVKGDFDNAEYEYQGFTTRFTREGDAFFMTTVDPDWARKPVGPPRYRKLSVDRTVGSHWVQEYMHRERNGQFTRMPVLYHIVEKKWVHSHGAFLAPEDPDFWGKCREFTWNDTCLYCHNTGPVKNPVPGPRNETVGYRTEVAELGISCEACHGPAGDHVRLNANPARRFDLQQRNGDPTIVQPERLSVLRRDEICARCHGALVPRREMWDSRSHKDPFIAGQDLLKFNHLFTSEAQQFKLAGKKHTGESHVDGRFWGDGTPLTTALEYNGMALSACYQQGHGKMSCLSCHSLHTTDPNMLLKPGMRSNEACLQCHNEYRERLSEHTRHAADSEASQCFSCHMPHQVYSLLTTHRSHRIQIPDLKDSVGTGKPHACNLCHLDKSLGWTREQLGRWSDRSKNVKLTEDEEKISSAVLLLATGDARSRAIMAGAFSQPAARRASGTDWFGPFLTRLMANERYPMVRALYHRGLNNAPPYDYLAVPEKRAAQLHELRSRFSAPVAPRPHLPLTPAGMPDEAVLERLLKKRHDPDLTINE